MCFLNLHCKRKLLYNSKIFIIMYEVYITTFGNILNVSFVSRYLIRIYMKYQDNFSELSDKSFLGWKVYKQLHKIFRKNLIQFLRMCSAQFIFNNMIIQTYKTDKEKKHFPYIVCSICMKWTSLQIDQSLNSKDNNRYFNENNKETTLGYFLFIHGFDSTFGQIYDYYNGKFISKLLLWIL